MAGDGYLDNLDVLGENGVIHGLDTVLESAANSIKEQDFKETDVFYQAIYS